VCLATASVLDSGTWKMIVQHKGTTLRYLYGVIGNGTDTSLWYDNWVNRNSL